MSRLGFKLSSARRPSADDRQYGKVMMPMAHTSTGRARLDHLQSAIETIVRERVPGDAIETGVWRGGAVIFMRGALDAFGQDHRTVWAADSFMGLPEPDEKYEHDRGALWHTRPELAVSLEQVQDHCRRYGMTSGIQFLKGWFSETLPEAPLERLAILRLDGDMYGSTMDALTALYDKVQDGGYVIVDDYLGVSACRHAVTDFREARGITEPIEAVDWTCAFWRKG